MEENTIKIIKKDRSEVSFDISKIVAVISKAMVDLFTGISDMAENITASCYTALHTFCHWLMNDFWSRRRKENKHNCPPHAIIMAIILTPSVKRTTNIFEWISKLIRNVYLLRNQDRGSTDSDSQENTPTYIATY